MVTNHLPSTPGWKGLESRSLDPLAPQPLQLMLKTGLLISRSCLRCWDVLTSLKLDWLATSLRVMLLGCRKLLTNQGRRSVCGNIVMEGLPRDFIFAIYPYVCSRSMRGSLALCDWILDGIVNTEFTDVAQVDNAGRNIELLRERGGLNNKRNHDGDCIQPTARNNNQKGYDQRKSDGCGYDRQNNNQDVPP
uniref:Zinc finger, CCHC-type, retrotransposon Gag domain protein n=1 Tax=Tanacetum cinerariifolium TaxID=118510 RepID=A0A699RK05_TANCI|nr:zinc finger, CCHC-type, retrotransposon Gag domain protein [Tanacetum cinerariifolium]